MGKRERERNKGEIWRIRESSCDFGDPFVLLNLCTEAVIPKSDVCSIRMLNTLSL